MNYKRYTGHNGKRRKVARLIKHLTNIYNNEYRYSAMEPVTERIYQIIMTMPKDDIIFGKPLKQVNDMMWAMERYEEQQYLISLTY